MVSSLLYGTNNSTFSIVVYIFFFHIFSANSHENVTDCLRRLLNNSEVNSVVSEAINEGGEKTVAACYLHDFTHMVYKPGSEEEVEVMLGLNWIAF